MKKYLILLLLPGWVFGAELPAADANGYRSTYEQPILESGDTARSGWTGHTLPTSCDQTVLAADANWSDITGNPTDTVFCVEEGSHTAKGQLSIPSGGTSGTRKWLVSWNATDGIGGAGAPYAGGVTDVKLKSISFGSGDSYWIIHRITIDQDDSHANHGIQFLSGAENNIVNESLFEECDEKINCIHIAGNDNLIQKSVFRETEYANGGESDGVFINSATGNKIISSEFYNVNKCIGTGSGSNAGSVVDNIDCYRTRSDYTDCNQNFIGTTEWAATTNYSVGDRRWPTNSNAARRNFHAWEVTADTGSSGATEPDWGINTDIGDTVVDDGITWTAIDVCAPRKALISFKRGGTSSNPVIIKNNRLWGARKSDRPICCLSTGDGKAISLSDEGGSGGADYVLVMNNVIMDSVRPIVSPRNFGDAQDPENNSIVGNIIYAQGEYDDSSTSTEGALHIINGDESEHYLNMIIQSKQWLAVNSSALNHDVRCNVIIDSGAHSIASGPDSSLQVDYNVFYGTTVYTLGGGSNNKDRSGMTDWSASASVVVNTVRVPTTPNGYLYSAIKAGTTNSSEPTFCTPLNCTTQDNTAVWKAVRGPKTIYRKLLTGSEAYSIPYASAASTTDLAEYNWCPGDGDSDELGSRTGIGLDDTHNNPW